MNSLPGQSELNSWLELATKGLPDEARQRICEEVEDHYWNTASDYEETGKSTEEAHREALAELGDVRQARLAFRDAHASKGRYLLAGLLTMAMPLIFAAVFRKEPEALVSTGPFRASLIGLLYLLQPLLLVLPMLAIIYSGYGLLSYRFRFDIGRWRVGLLIAGLLITFLPSCLNGLWMVATGQALFVDAHMGGAYIIRRLVGNIGIFLLSFGLLAVSYRINRLGHSLYGMRSALVASSWAWGFSQAGLVFANLENRVSLLVFVLMFTATAFCVCLGWMFIKAAFMGRPFLTIPGRGGTGAAT